MLNPKRILITNDDGFDSPALLALIDALKPLADIIIVAPTLEKSACGHSLTLTKPLRFVEIEPNFYKLDDGTPTDCVFLALHKIYNEKNMPDLVVSGINIGANMGEDITYSGTASGAMEAVLQGVPAIAISQNFSDDMREKNDFDYALAKQSIRVLVEKIFKGSFPLEPRKFLNVNIPALKPSESKGFKVTKTGSRVYTNDADSHINPRGQEYFWIGLVNHEWRETKGQMTDIQAVKNGYISLTPIHLDMTSHNDIESLKKWI
ncbi:MAG: 5-nucleotidase SurE (EC [uncultured Sulfurovum sp.]|uniref:5'-nucleotidase SurE n=1 Tax=uncultured Sulfurovum sp. TaxID=269237 RepID=A0A6S6S5G1_9BACT|nr:MAG: 5-nucleotidase SurE (EC [uncultured Sulfurovum sp.]